MKAIKIEDIKNKALLEQINNKLNPGHALNPSTKTNYYKEEASYSITSKLQTLNEYINAERTNKFIASSMKKKYTAICCEAARRIAGTIDPEALYDLLVDWVVEDDRTDSDNIYFGIKFILDGLRDSAAIKDDNRKFIRNISNTIQTGDTYIVGITLKKVEP